MDRITVTTYCDTLVHMRLVICTPLYPPDIAEPAPYVKELAKRLAKECAVTIVTYGRLPEQVEGVQIVAVDKRRSLLPRLFSYTRALWSAARDADCIYLQNGPSVELPAALVLTFLRKKLVVHIGDRAAHEYAQKKFWRRALESWTFGKAEKIITESPLPRPEILPLEERPDTALAQWEQSWTEHIAILKKVFYGK